MSQENLEVIRGVHEHLHRTGEQPREAYAEDLTGDASRLPGFGVYRGREEVISAWLAYADTFDEWWLEVKEVLDGQGERVFVATRDGGQMKASGSEVHNDFFMCTSFATARSLPGRCSWIEPKPSKPPGCGGRDRLLLCAKSRSRFADTCTVCAIGVRSAR